jgi:F-box-like
MHELGALGAVPTETLLNVFMYLDGHDLARCLRVSNNGPDFKGH